MSPDTHRNEIEAAAADLVTCLVRRNQHASIHLARLISIDRANKGCAYRLFARALAQ